MSLLKGSLYNRTPKLRKYNVTVYQVFPLIYVSVTLATSDIPVTTPPVFIFTKESFPLNHLCDDKHFIDPTILALVKKNVAPTPPGNKLSTKTHGPSRRSGRYFVP